MGVRDPMISAPKPGVDKVLAPAMDFLQPALLCLDPQRRQRRELAKAVG
jgi:hypothetical protein